MEGNKRRRYSQNPVYMDSYAYRSRLKYWNAAYKAAFSILALIIVIAADSVEVSLFTAVYMGGLTVGAGKIRISDYIHLLLIPAAFIVTGGIAVLIQFGRGTDSMFLLPFFATNLYITKSSLLIFISLVCKAFGAVSCLYMLTLSTPMGEIISVLQKLHLPGFLVELMHLIYRYIFILLEINAKQKDAARSRLGYCDRKTAIRTFGSEIANLFVLSMKKSESYYDALESRSSTEECRFWEEKRRLLPSQAILQSVYLLSITIGYMCLQRFC